MGICAEHISFAYNGQPVLSDFNMELPAHGIIGLSGPSGCGKTTLLHLMAGLIKPDSGSFKGIAGHRIGVVFQEYRLLPWLTAAENLNLIIRNQAQTAEWLLNMQLAEQANFYPSELSGGMKRRIALARALAFDCDLLLLDEPFQGLDQDLKEKMYEWVRAAALIKPVLMVTHDKLEISELADQFYQASGPPLYVKRV
ncbi:MAG: ATP-binding cassette domain-containing protein [Eubacteriales bacterium]